MMILLASAATALSQTTRPDPAGWIELFDGRSLSGWRAMPPESARTWSVREGCLVGRGVFPGQVYLVWEGEPLRDFELELEYRLPGHGNTGIELRARPDPTGRRPLIGYHADLGHVGIGRNILGAWDFHFAGRPEPACPRGTRLVFESDGTMHTSRIPDAVQLRDLHPHGWNRVRIVARGFHFRFHLNGKLSAEFIDKFAEGRFASGALGLQVHEPGMEVWFRKLRLRRLTTGPERPQPQPRTHPDREAPKPRHP